MFGAGSLVFCLFSVVFWGYMHYSGTLGMRFGLKRGGSGASCMLQGLVYVNTWQ